MGKLIEMLNLGPDTSSWPSMEEATRTFQREYLIQVLKTANGNRCLAAHLLQIHRNTLARHCESLGIQPDRYRVKKKDREGLRVSRLVSDESPGAVERLVSIAERTGHAS